MNIKAFYPFACAIGMITLLLLQGCDKETEPQLEFGAVENGEEVKQIDMTVLVPIHPSSLEYFDYYISYSDNTGEEYRDTVRSVLPDNEIFWIRNFSYKSPYVIFRCETTLVPKVSRDSVVSFSFIIPKPYIFPRVIYKSSSTSGSVNRLDMEALEIQKYDNIRIGSFMSTYGSYFSSTCSVKDSYDGISFMFY